MKEPNITINGIPLGEGQIMTIRAALTHFYDYLVSNSLGEDEHGIAM
jgi:hypothetical protein